MARHLNPKQPTERQRGERCGQACMALEGLNRVMGCSAVAQRPSSHRQLQHPRLPGLLQLVVGKVGTQAPAKAIQALALHLGKGGGSEGAVEDCSAVIPRHEERVTARGSTRQDHPGTCFAPAKGGRSEGAVGNCLAVIHSEGEERETARALAQAKQSTLLCPCQGGW